MAAPRISLMNREFTPTRGQKIRRRKVVGEANSRGGYETDTVVYMLPDGRTAGCTRERFLQWLRLTRAVERGV